MLERLGIAGSGTVACGVAACAAAREGDVTVWARSERSADQARRRIAGLCEKLGVPGGEQRVHLTDDISALEEATLLVEAIRESRPDKAAVLGRLGAAAKPGALIASTTSSLNVAELAAACGRPERFFALHVFNPVHKMELVELCFPERAEADVRDRARAFCEAIGKTPVEVPDQTAFVVNRLLFPYLFDAVRLLERTGMKPEEVDACMRLGAAHPMGPLELLDLVGLDVADSIGRALHAETGEPAHEPPGRIKFLVGRGRLGRKTGHGFYDYPRP